MYKVLIVDDEDLMREVIKKIVVSVKEFSIILTAKNGKEAVNICKNIDIDIIFMDIMMPVMNGIEASEKILNIKSNSNIYIVSSYHNFELAQTAIKNKIKGYFIKPVQENKIVEVLKEYKSNQIIKNDIMLDEINFLIEKKDFIGLYKIIPNVTEEIMKKNPSKSLKENLYKIADTIMYSFYPEYHLKNKNKIENILPFSDRFVEDERMVHIWLYKLLDFIFQKRSTDRYLILKNVFSYIEENIKMDISLNTIVKKCNISQGYLSRIFKKEFNLTVMQYMHIKKINLAKEYICLTEKSVSEVSYEVGYNEFSYFCKVFKKYEKRTVTEFRNNQVDN